MDSFFSWFSFCQRRPPKKRRTRNTQSIPSPLPPPPISQNAVFIHASTIVDDIEKVLLINNDDTLVEESELDCDSAVSAIASANLLRITLLARGKTRNDIDVRMRYVTVTCERLFLTLDALQPIDVLARETRRALLQRLLKAEKMAECVGHKVQ